MFYFSEREWFFCQSVRSIVVVVIGRFLSFVSEQVVVHRSLVGCMIARLLQNTYQRCARANKFFACGSLCRGTCMWCGVWRRFWKAPIRVYYWLPKTVSTHPSVSKPHWWISACTVSNSLFCRRRRRRRLLPSAPLFNFSLTHPPGWTETAKVREK